MTNLNARLCQNMQDHIPFGGQEIENDEIELLYTLEIYWSQPDLPEVHQVQVSVYILLGVLPVAHSQCANGT
jgi:hypothetical protein